MKKVTPVDLMVNGNPVAVAVLGEWYGFPYVAYREYDECRRSSDFIACVSIALCLGIILAGYWFHPWWLMVTGTISFIVSGVSIEAYRRNENSANYQLWKGFLKMVDELEGIISRRYNGSLRNIGDSLLEAVRAELVSVAKEKLSLEGIINPTGLSKSALENISIATERFDHLFDVALEYKLVHMTKEELFNAAKNEIKEEANKKAAAAFAPPTEMPAVTETIPAQ